MIAHSDESFAPIWRKNPVAFNRKFAGYFNPSLPPYDALLNEYEEGLTVETLDRFFAQLRETLVPLLAKVAAAEPIDDSFLHYTYPLEQQRQLSDYIMSVLGIYRCHCGIAESEHPFTTGFNNMDVRITTHYHEQDVASSRLGCLQDSHWSGGSIGYPSYALGAPTALRCWQLWKPRSELHLGRCGQGGPLKVRTGSTPTSTAMPPSTVPRPV